MRDAEHNQSSVIYANSIQSWLLASLLHQPFPNLCIQLSRDSPLFQLSPDSVQAQLAHFRRKVTANFNSQTHNTPCLHYTERMSS